MFAELAEFHIELKRKKGMSAKHVRTLKSVSVFFAEQFVKNVTKLPVPMRTDYNEPCFLRSHQFKSQPAVVTTLTESGNSAGMLGGAEYDQMWGGLPVPQRTSFCRCSGVSQTSLTGSLSDVDKTALLVDT